MQHNNEDLLKLGNHIKNLRLDKKLTIRMLCYNKGLGLEPSTISRIEQGIVDPKYLTLLKIAEALDIEIKDLLNF